MDEIKERRKVRTTAANRRHNAIEARFGYAPFLRRIEVVPGVGIVLEAKNFVIRPEHRWGWISMQIGGNLCKIAFKLVTSWSQEALKCLGIRAFSSRLMRCLYPVFMQSKCEGLIDYFRIEGMFFDRDSGFSTEYQSY